MLTKGMMRFLLMNLVDKYCCSCWSVLFDLFDTICNYSAPHRFKILISERMKTQLGTSVCSRSRDVGAGLHCEGLSLL